jgi:hypothetical protein
VSHTEQAGSLLYGIVTKCSEEFGQPMGMSDVGERPTVIQTFDRTMGKSLYEFLLGCNRDASVSLALNDQHGRVDFRQPPPQVELCRDRREPGDITNRRVAHLRLIEVPPRGVERRKPTPMVLTPDR